MFSDQGLSIDFSLPLVVRPFSSGASIELTQSWRRFAHLREQFLYGCDAADTHVWAAVGVGQEPLAGEVLSLLDALDDALVEPFMPSSLSLSQDGQVGTSTKTDEVKQDTVACRGRMAAKDEARGRQRNSPTFTFIAEH